LHPAGPRHRPVNDDAWHRRATGPGSRSFGRLRSRRAAHRRLAGEGQTNRQIAQRLFITAKTGEVHLARAFRKPHIDSRAQLPAALSSARVPATATQPMHVI